VAFSKIKMMNSSKRGFPVETILQAISNQGKEHKMFSKKIILISIVGTVMLVCSGRVWAGTFHLQLSTTYGNSIAQPIMPKFDNHSIHKKHTFIHTNHRTFLKKRPHPHKVVVVRGPFRRQIAVNLVPAITVRTPEVVIKHIKVTVWITNSNGSLTSVSLRKSGPGFVGPRGEYYPNMPTEKQLRIVYGF
jgi:hypothetical protein